jgi:hypothetical protein
LAAVILTACAAPSQPAAQGGGASLLVSGGSVQKTYTAANLEELPATQAAFKDVQYKGVSASTLLTDAGFDPQTVKAVKAVASDGFTVNYDPAQFLREDFVVAYARADGALAPDDGAFRIVLPGAEGKLNVRMMVEIQVIE